MSFTNSIVINGPTGSTRIRLGEHSKGVQWYFSITLSQSNCNFRSVSGPDTLILANKRRVTLYRMSTPSEKYSLMYCSSYTE